MIDGDFKKCARKTKELNEDQLMFTLSQVRILINEIFELHTCKNYICNIAPSLYMLIQNDEILQHSVSCVCDDMTQW